MVFGTGSERVGPKHHRETVGSGTEEGMQNQSPAEKRWVKLVELEGYICLDELLGAAAIDGVSPAICLNEGCEYTAEMEPDQDPGWCEARGTNTVASALVLAGVI
jgi:hypothetical protein